MSPALAGLIFDLIALGLDAFLNHTSAWEEVSEVIASAKKENRDLTPAEISAIRKRRATSLSRVGQALHQRELREREEAAAKAEEEKRRQEEEAAAKEAAEAAKSSEENTGGDTPAE